MGKGVLLVNLGSPDSPSVPDVRRYLNEFLMDRRVIDSPWLVRRLIVGLILIKRPKESAHAYQKIWTPEGSPLVVTSHHVQKKLQQRVTVPVELAMRYQNPSIASALKKLADKDVTDLLVIPLFPHYAMSSYESAAERVKEVAAKMAPQMKIKILPPYFDAPDYIAALAASAKNHLEGGYDHLLFSFHGIPERHLHKSDPTGCHCLVKENCCEISDGGQSARTARDLLPRAMLQNCCGLRRPGGCAAGKIFRFVPIPARQGPVAETLHGSGTRTISRAGHQETARHLPGLCLGLPGDN